jgi:hypothetical protein
MFNRKTLFIIGTGAGFDIEVPVGWALAEDIARRTLIKIDSGRLSKATADEDLALNFFERSDPKANEYIKAFQLIRNGVLLANSIDDFLNIMKSPKKSLPSERRPSFARSSMRSAIVSSTWTRRTFTTNSMSRNFGTHGLSNSCRFSVPAERSTKSEVCCTTCLSSTSTMIVAWNIFCDTRWRSCAASSRGRLRTASWRRQLQVRYPTEARNIPAAAKLDQLADEVNELSDEAWAELSPHYEWCSGRWADAVSMASRHVFFHNVKTLPAFINDRSANRVGINSDTVG